MNEPRIHYFHTYEALAANAHSFAAGDYYRVEARAEPCPGCGKPTEVRRVTFRDNGEHVCTLVYCPLCAAQSLNKN